jgi:hypothetical protein
MSLPGDQSKVFGSLQESVGRLPTVFLPTTRTIDQFFDLLGQFLAAQKQITLSYMRAGTQIAQATSESIRARAYELYEQGDRQPGHSVDDWLHAQTELNADAR